MKQGLIFLLMICCSFTPFRATLSPDRDEAKAAYLLINKMRANPSAYSADMGVDLSAIKKMPALTWNDTLAIAAEKKALDMAQRKYFNHVTPEGYGMNYFISKAGYTLDKRWLANPANNFFESIQAGAANGEESVRFLIVDSNIPSLGHRKHLLGIDEWNASLYDIGIGFVKAEAGAYYQSYTCILIAKHQ